jgi:hypothetical protein
LACETASESDSILLVNGSNRKYYSEPDLLLDVVYSIKKIFGQDQNVIIKNKIFQSVAGKKKFNDHFSTLLGVTILDETEESVYEYLLSSKLVIIIEGGTTVVESFLVNRKTIIFGDGIFAVPQRIKKKLMFADDQMTFENCLLKIKNGRTSKRKHLKKYIDFLRKLNFLV